MLISPLACSDLSDRLISEIQTVDMTVKFRSKQKLPADPFRPLPSNKRGKFLVKGTFICCDLSGTIRT